MSDKFFNAKQAAAVLKHGILRRYLELFCRKTGSRSRGNRVVYLDGYAGPGMYSDGQSGSPSLAVAMAERLGGKRNVFGIYVEENVKAASDLEANLAKTHHNYKVLRGDLSCKLPEALSLVTESDPLFAFFDPFGLPIPLEQVKEVMRHARKDDHWWPATEVLLNFQYKGFSRTAGHLNAPSQNPRYLRKRKTILERLDITLGGDWWRQIWMSGDADRVSRIAAAYGEQVMQQTSVPEIYCVHVPARLGGPTLYDLMLLTHRPDEGSWFFNECVSSALEDFYKFCTRDELHLDLTADYASRWVSEIRSNILRLLRERDSINVSAHWRRIYGKFLGQAREKHLRQAIRELHKEGAIRGGLTGQILEFVIRRPA